LRAPTMGAVTAGWAPTQAIASAAGSKPCSRAKAVKRSAVFHHPAVAVTRLDDLLLDDPARRGHPADAVFSAEEPSAQRAVGDDAQPSAKAMGRISHSACRLTRLYIGWRT